MVGNDDATEPVVAFGQGEGPAGVTPTRSMDKGDRCV